MRRSIRVSREAQRVLAEQPRLRVPIDIHGIAARYALLTEREMDDDISGMLVPLQHLANDRSWAIVVNKAHATVRRRFTIAHELGHLFLHGYTAPHADRGFLIRLRSSRASDGTVAEEIEANQFAAELLMPRDLLVRKLIEKKIEYVPVEGEDDATIADLAKEFRVSQQALSIRLANLFR